MFYYILERRKGINETENANVFLSSQLDNIVKYIKDNKDSYPRTYSWFWSVIKIEPDDDWGGEYYKSFDMDGNELCEQPIDYPF